MPRKKGKRQKRKIELSEELKQKKAIDTRLMVINLKIDDYVYKKKPISIEEADMYAREMEEFRHQSRDERCLQVIEKLISYMKCIIRENSPKDIVHSIIAPIEDSTKQMNNDNESTNESNMTDEISLSTFSSLSIVEPEDPLTISVINTYQKKVRIEKSTSTVANENLNEKKNPETCSSEIKSKITSPEMDNIHDITQKPPADYGSKLNNFEYEDPTSLSKLRNYRKTKNEKPEKTRQNTKIIVKNSTSKDVDDESQLSPNLLSNFEYENFTPLNINPKNITLERNNVTDIRNDKNERNIITSLKEVDNINTIKLKDLEISTEKNVLPQKLSNFTHRNTRAISALQNNTNLKNIRQSQIRSVPYNNADTRYNATNYNNQEYNNTKLAIRNLNNVNERDRECVKLTQNLPSNFEQIQYDSLQNNLKNSKIFKTPIIASQHYSRYQANGIEKVKKQRKYVRKDTIGATRKTVNVVENSSQNQANGIEKATKKKRRDTVKKDYSKTQQMRESKQNSERIVISDQTATNSGQNKKRKLFNNKTREDLTWVDNIKFLRVIETEEFTRIDNLDESFWSDVTLPSNIISLKDFECDDNISIWK